MYLYRQAAAILVRTSLPEVLTEIEPALLDFHITVRGIGVHGESDMPQKYSGAFHSVR